MDQIFFFNDTATTEIYTLSYTTLFRSPCFRSRTLERRRLAGSLRSPDARMARSEEHTSELQSLAYIVCRLLLEKKNDDTFVALQFASGVHTHLLMSVVARIQGPRMLLS